MKRVLPIIIVILLIIGVGGGVVWSILAGRYKPTEGGDGLCCGDGII